MRSIRKLSTITALVGASVIAGTTASAEDINNRINELDQKVRIVERKLEIADETATTKAKESATVAASKSGFNLTSADKAFSLKLRGFIQADSRTFLSDDDKRFNDSLLLRRARLITDIDLGTNFSGRIAPDFGGGSTALQDAYIDVKLSAPFNIRIGRQKVPLGLERWQSSADTSFNETSLATALTPNFDQGINFFGNVGGIADYALGVFNGGPDGASIDSDTNDDKDIAARLWLSPFKNSDSDALAGLSFGVAGTFGKQSGTTNAPGLPSFRTSGQNTFFSYRTSTNAADIAIADGERTRIAPQLFYALGSFGLLGEYVISEQDVKNGKGTFGVQNDAWNLSASYVLTGETPSLRGVDPKNEFSRTDDKWGAFELIARVGELNVDDAAFDAKLADASRSASAAQNWGLGLNWYATRNARFSLNYETTTFDGGAKDADRADEEVIIARAQLKF